MKTTKVLIGLLCILITYPASGYLMATQTLPKVDKPTKAEKPVTITYEEGKYRSDHFPSPIPKKLDITFWPGGTFTSSHGFSGTWELKNGEYRWEDDSDYQHCPGGPPRTCQEIGTYGNRVPDLDIYTKYKGRFFIRGGERGKITIEKTYKTEGQADVTEKGHSRGKCSRNR